MISFEPQTISLLENTNVNRKQKREMKTQIKSKQRNEVWEFSTTKVLLNVMMVKHAILKMYLKWSRLLGAQRNKTHDKHIFRKSMEKYCMGKVTEAYKRYCINKRDKLPTQSLKNFVSCLKTLAKSHNFCNSLYDSLIYNQILLGLKKSKPPRGFLGWDISCWI